MRNGSKENKNPSHFQKAYAGEPFAVFSFILSAAIIKGADHFGFTLRKTLFSAIGPTKNTPLPPTRGESQLNLHKSITSEMVFFARKND